MRIKRLRLTRHFLISLVPHVLIICGYPPLTSYPQSPNVSYSVDLTLRYMMESKVPYKGASRTPSALHRFVSIFVIGISHQRWGHNLDKKMFFFIVGRGNIKNKDCSNQTPTLKFRLQHGVFMPLLTIWATIFCQSLRRRVFGRSISQPSENVKYLRGHLPLFSGGWFKYDTVKGRGSYPRHSGEIQVRPIDLTSDEMFHCSQ